MRRPSAGFLLFVAVLAAGAVGCSAEGGGEQVGRESGRELREVRDPVVAGTFYPGDPATLAATVDGYLEEADVPRTDGEIVGIIAPHAGYVYSGGVAAHAYAALLGRSYDTVIVIAPSHRYGFRGASIYGGDGYGTPLGVVRVDRDLADALLDDGLGFVYEPRAHAGEHSLEVQVPFLQRTLGEFEIVPVVMGSQGEGAVRALAARVAGAVRERTGKRVLLVASTDLSHYHDDRAAKALDAHVVEAVAEFDPEGLLASLAAGECEACGGGPAAAVMMAARELGAERARVAAYATSGDVTGDRSQVVGYVSALILGSGASGADARRGGDSRAAAESGSTGTGAGAFAGVNCEEQLALIDLARSTIVAVSGGREPPTLDLESPTLDTPCGAFVTLEKDGRLRGCIGYVRAVKPLREAVRDMAVQAAFHDPRFPPVAAGEIPDLEIEISVLSPLVTVTDVSEIVVGRDGLIVRIGSASGLLLPQVATDHGWDRDAFLDHTCVKAGLPAGCWRRDDAEIMRFTAQVFGEAGDSGAGS